MNKTWKLNVLYIYQALVLLSPILNNYLLIPIQFIYVICAVGFVLYLVLLAEKKIGLSWTVIIYLGYVVVLSVFNGVRTEGVTEFLIFARMAYFFLIVINFYILLPQIWHYKKCLNLYKKICCILSILILIQFVLGQLGISVSLVPPGLITNTADLMPSNTYRINQVAEQRFSTFFLEPAYQAQYCLPCLALILFTEQKIEKKKIIIALLLSGGLVATTSMQGILGTGIIWILYIFVLIKQRKLSGYYRLLTLIPVICMAVFIILSRPVLQEQFQKKILSINQGEIQRDSSLYVRMIYGWECYRELGLFYKFFGYGYSNSSTFLLSSGIGLQFTSLELISYMSGLSKMFCELGIVGTMLNFMIMLFPLLKRKKERRDTRIIGLIITVLIIMLTSDTFDTLSSLIPMTFAFGINRINKRSIL